jgi:hypothetical protein
MFFVANTVDTWSHELANYFNKSAAKMLVGNKWIDWKYVYEYLCTGYYGNADTMKNHCKVW